MSETDALPVAIGTHVEVELIDNRGEVETLALDIVPDQAADFDQGRLGASTPLAQALLGHPTGAELPYARADVIRVRIISVNLTAGETPDNAADRRQDVLRRALDAAERTNAAMFAASFSGKWGDYDPKGIDNWEE